MSQHESKHCASCGNYFADNVQLDVHEVGELLLSLNGSCFVFKNRTDMSERILS